MPNNNPSGENQYTKNQKIGSAPHHDMKQKDGKNSQGRDSARRTDGSADTRTPTQRSSGDRNDNPTR